MSSNMVFIYPTDTVWGIGADLRDEVGHKMVHQIKGSDQHKPLSVLFTSRSQLREYFSFFNDVNDEIINHFFSLEVSLGLEVRLLCKEVPTYITGSSEMIFIRCLPFLNDIIKMPITTTSLNLTSCPVIVNRSEAINFYQHNVMNKTHQSLFIDLDISLSGQSSTMVVIKSNQLDVLRKGRHWQKIIEYGKLFTT